MMILHDSMIRISFLSSFVAYYKVLASKWILGLTNMVSEWTETAWIIHFWADTIFLLDWYSCIWCNAAWSETWQENIVTSECLAVPLTSSDKLTSIPCNLPVTSYSVRSNPEQIFSMHGEYVIPCRHGNMILYSFLSLEMDIDQVSY